MDCKKHKYTKIRKHMLNLAFFALLLAVTVFFICRKINWQVIGKMIVKLRPEYLVLATAVSLLYIFFEGLGYKTLIKPLGKNISITESIAYASINIYFSAITPSAIGGQPAVAFYMKRKGIPYTHSSIVLLLNVVLYTFSLLIFTGIAIIISPTLIFTNGGYITALFIIGTTVTIALALLCIFAMFSSSFIRRLGALLIGIGYRLKIITNKEERLAILDGQLDEYRRSRSFISENKRALLIAFACNMMQRIANYSVAYLIYRGLGCSGVSYLELMSTQILIAAAVSFVPLPGAIGITEAVFVRLLSYVYAAEFIFPAMLLTRTVNYYFCVIVSAVITIAANALLLGSSSKDDRHQ